MNCQVFKLKTVEFACGKRDWFWCWAAQRSGKSLLQEETVAGRAMRAELEDRMS